VLPGALAFEAKLQDEELLLDSMLAAMSRGGTPPEVWEKLHAAAQRDERLSELAFAFESVSQGKRLKTMTPASAAEFLFQAGRYFSDVFGDELGAVTYLERALALAPTHGPAFERIERLLLKTPQPRKLAEVYAAAAQHRPRGEQAPWLRRAADLLAQAGGADERVLELWQHVVRLDPADEDARERLEALYVRANRLRDVVRLNEQALSSDPPPEEGTRKRLLARIIELYEGKLHEPERAMPHVEHLLTIDPGNEEARRVAQKLIVIKGLAGRAAAALAAASESYGAPQEVARYLSIELENTRGPKRAALLARLGRLRHEKMADDKGAFEALEQALAIDASSDELRDLYLALAAGLGRWLDAAKTLGRVLATMRDAGVKAKATAQMGEMLLRGGDVKRAKAALGGVLAAADTPPEAALASARLLREILEGEGDGGALCEALERLSALETDEARRAETDERLADLATQRKDVPRAIGAYERLLATPARAKALAALVPLYEASGDPEKQARLLEERAKDTADPAEARHQLMRAATVRANEAKDAPAAIATCRAVIERFGPARDVLALLLPLLEAQRRWPELADALAQEAALTTGTDHAERMARLGVLRMARLRDISGAIEAFDEALAFDPHERTARSTLEKLAALGDHRLAAARVLEPLYRREGAGGALLKVLELRGALAADLEERLEALRETADLAASAGAAEAPRAVDAVGRGLAEAVAGNRPLREWLNRLDRVAGPGTDAKRRAAILGGAIGEHEVTSDELSALAKFAAEANAAAGDAQAAIALYRRALSFEPESAELLSRIDDLLRDQGSPAERVALYRAAIGRIPEGSGRKETVDRSGPARRKELLHRIGVIERRDLGDMAAAVATYRALLEEDADDADAHRALAELYTEGERWDDLCTLLEGRLARSEGDVARALRATLAEIASAHGDEARARAQCARLLEDAQLGPEHLDAVQRTADRLGDADLARAVLHRRAEMAQDPREQIAWLDRLGELDEELRGDLDAAAAAWKRGAALAEATGDDESARRLYGRARKVAPEDPELTARLAALYERAQSWSELPRLYAWLAEHTTDEGERVDLWLRAARILSERLGEVQAAARRAALAFEAAPTRADVLATFERMSVAAGALEDFERAVDDALVRLEAGQAASPEQRTLLLLAKVRALASDPSRADEAARACRGVLADARVGRASQAEALSTLDALIAAAPESHRRRADRRWVLEWRADHAPEEERTARLLEWAREEEKAFADPVHALALYRRVLTADGECDEALSAVARLALATGDTEDALAALRARRDRAEGPARIAIELEIAQALLSRTTRWRDALDALRAVLAEAPGDAAARGLAAQLLAHRATRAGAIAMLEQACDATEDVDARAQMLTRLLDAPADADDAAARRRWFERLSELQREQGSLDAALATAARAAREMPDVAALWDRAEGLARELARPDEVAALYEEVLARQLARDQVLTIGERAVQFYEEWFEDPARVVRILGRVLELDMSADWAFDRLKLILDSSERWDDLFALYDRALEHAEGRKRATLLEDAAQTAKDFADRPDRAIQYLEQLHELKPGDAKLASALERLYERQGRHRELVSLLTARLPSLKRDEARRTRVRVSTLWLDELGDPGAALEVVEPVLQPSEDAANSAMTDVWVLLERILAAAPPQESRKSSAPPSTGDLPRSRRSPRKTEPPGGPSVRQRTAEILRAHYASSSRDADLARMLLIELEAVKSAKERAKRHLQVADLFEKLGDYASALEQVGLAVVLDPSDDSRRARLVVLAERTGRLERLADVLSTAAEVCDDLPSRVSLTMQAAVVRADRIGDGAGAITLLASVLAARGVGDEEVLDAARRLEPLLEAAGRAEERLEVIERIAAVEPEVGARRDALGRAARLAAQLGQNERAIGLWEKRVGIDERDAEALDGLVDLLEREGRNERLAEVLALRSRATATPERQRADRVRLAKLVGDVLGRPEESIDLWREVERDFGEADDSSLALATLLRATRRWEELAELLERGARRTADDGTRAELLRQLGDVRREQLGDMGAAIATYARALAEDPRNAGARLGLLTLAHDDVHRPGAVDALLHTLRTCDDWQGILELTSHRLLAAGTPKAKIAILREAAQIAEGRARDAGLAFEAMRRAFVITPSEPELEREAARLAEAAGAWRGLVDAYREAIEGEARGDAALLAELRSKVGTVLETRLENPQGALASYLEVVRDTASLDSGYSAIRVASKLAQWDVAARTLTDLAWAHGDSVPNVLDAYERAAEAPPAWDEATRALGEATTAVGLRGEAARDVEARLAVWHRDRRSDADAAEAAFRRALAHDEANPTLLSELAQLQRRGRGRPLVDSLLRLSRATGGDLALLREAVEVARDAVGDKALARGILEELLALARKRWQDATQASGGAGRSEEGTPVTLGDPSELAAYAEWSVESLAHIHEEEGDARAVVEVLVAGDALPFEAAIRRDMRRRAARVALERLGDHERAISLYLALFDDDPRDEEAVDRLAATYAAHGRTRELLALRERQVEAAPDSEARIALRLEAARLLVQIGNSERAADLLRSSLAEDPRHAATVETLASVLDGDIRTRDLRDLLADQARLAQEAGDVARAVDLWSRAAVLAEERLRDREAAEAFHAHVVALAPSAKSLDALSRLTTARGDPAAAAGWLERLLDVEEPARRGDVLLRLADALAAAGQATRAAERLEAELAGSPGSEPLRARLALLYREQGDWTRLAKLVADAAGHAPDKPTRMARLLEAANLLAERCGTPELAVPLLEQAADLAPGDPSVRLRLADSLAHARRFDDARAILQTMIEAFGGRRPKERAPVHYQIARLELAMGNRARALVELDTATRVDPQNPETLRTLAELARDDGQLDRAEKSYRALLVVLRRREEAGESHSIARSEVLLELSAIAQRQGQAERAGEILESALEAASRGEFEQERLEAALRTRGDYETLVRVLEGKLARGGESPGMARALAELAEVLAERLGRPNEALPVRLRAVALDPRAPATHDAALGLARAIGAVDRYVDSTTALVDRAIDGGDVPLACALLLRLGRVAEQDMHDDVRSAALLERAVDLGLRSPDVLRALDHVYERLGDSTRQARVLSLRVEVEALEGGPRAASDAIYRLAALRLASRATIDEGVEMLQTALDLDPQLERAEEALRRAAELDPQHRRLVDLYEHVGRQPGHERALIEALKLRSRLPGGDIETVRQAVEVAVRIGDPALAESLLERFAEGEESASQNVSNLAWAMGALASLREAAGDLRKAVELKIGAARLADPEIARKLQFEVARIAAERLEDLPLAAATYEELREADPADREAWEPLAAVYRRLGAAQKLASLLGSVVEYVEDSAERSRLRLERVRTMVDGLGLPDAEAAPLLREIVDDDASQVDAALALASILERSGARSELAELLARQMEAAKDRGDAASVASLAFRLGTLLARVDGVEARNVFYTGLDWEPKNRRLLDALLAVLDESSDAGERADLAERRLAVEQGPAAEDMALSLARTRTETGDEAGAQRALELGFAAHPASAALRERLEAAFRASGEWQKLAELCVRDASARVDVAERVARLREAAAIWRAQLGDPRAAAGALRLAREVAPEDPSLLRDHVDMLIEAADHASALAELAAAIESLAPDDGRRAELLAARARVRGAIGDSDSLEDLESAFRLDPDAYAGALAERLGQARAAAQSDGDAAAVRALRLREAEVLPYAGDPDGARAILAELVKQDAKDVAALRLLANLEVAVERWDAASAALRRLVGLEEGGVAIETALRLADACERAGRPGDARGALERARLVAPNDAAVRNRLERVYDQLGAWHELADLALEDTRSTGDVAERFAQLLRAGALLLEKAGDPAAALAPLGEARALRPADPDCVALLADALTLSGRVQEAAAMLDQVIAPHRGRRARELAPLYWRVARVARYAGDTPGEVRAMVQALECDAQNGTVCADVAQRAAELDQLDLANRAFRSITLLKTPGPIGKGLAYQFLGEIARKQNDPKRAVMLLKRALMEDSTLEGARALIDAIENRGF
jgi:tetratricopeptide (TPR) repeat protein